MSGSGGRFREAFPALPVEVESSAAPGADVFPLPEPDFSADLEADFSASFASSAVFSAVVLRAGLFLADDFRAGAVSDAALSPGPASTEGDSVRAVSDGAVFDGDASDCAPPAGDFSAGALAAFFAAAFLAGVFLAGASGVVASVTRAWAPASPAGASPGAFPASCCRVVNQFRSTSRVTPDWALLISTPIPAMAARNSLLLIPTALAAACARIFSGSAVMSSMVRFGSDTCLLRPDSGRDHVTGYR